MRVVVTNVYDGEQFVAEGSEEEVKDTLFSRYRRIIQSFVGPDASVDSMVRLIGRKQSYSITVEQDEDKTPKDREFTHMGDNLSVIDSEQVNNMFGVWPRLESVFAAAKFLAGGSEPHLSSIRSILWHYDGDLSGAALRAYGLEDTQSNRKALDAVCSLQNLHKSQPEPIQNAKIVAATPSGEDMAEAIRRAAAEGEVFAVKLDGKHSAGSMVAKDHKEQRAILLKPGSGKQSPAAGAREDPSTQSEREAAFYAVARIFGLEDDLPECHLVFINDKQYAAMHLLGHEYEQLEAIHQKDRHKPSAILERYRQRGQLHCWAVMDFIMGNPDRHAANIMVNKQGDVKLIDHGSAFAGSDFAPSHDKNSFIPFYLRYLAPSDPSFNLMSYKDKLRYMVLAPESRRDEMRQWLDRIDSQAIVHVLVEFGIDPKPVLDRLEKLQATKLSVDMAINHLWAGT